MRHTLEQSPQRVAIAVILPISIVSLHFKVFLHVLFTYTFTRCLLNVYCVPRPYLRANSWDTVVINTNERSLSS